MNLKRLLPESFRDAYRGRWEWLQLWVPWILRRIAGRNPPPVNTDGRVLIHLGCGGLVLPGFINVDSRPFPHIHHLAQVQRLSFLADNSVDVIYVVHCLEHLAFDETSKALGEWHRVLKPDGSLYVAVPDFDRILEVYEKSGKSIPLIQQVLMGGQSYPENFHFAIFNVTFLSDLLQRAGFEEISHWDNARAAGFDIVDCSSATLPSQGVDVPISLNLKARKVRLQK